MAKFKNKKTKKIVEVDLLYYQNQLRTNPNWEEIKDNTSSKNKKTEEEEKPLQ